MIRLSNSPYVVVKFMHLADESVMGDRLDPCNPLGWTSVRLNLPGMPEYNPGLSWVSRIRSDAPRYVDDLRPVGTSADDCWLVAHTLAFRYGSLGLQITSRKMRPPSQRPGAWSGAFVSATAEGVGVSCGQVKWEKAQRIISELVAMLSLSDSLNHKDLEQKRGFLVHLQRTYPCIMPFLKGIHLTLDGWRPRRDPEGWKDVSYDPEVANAFGQDSGRTQPPTSVVAVPHLTDDLHALSSLFSPSNPPVRFVCASHTLVALYGFGDASGSVFGSSIALPDGSTLV
jgi:hypothetical protein